MQATSSSNATTTTMVAMTTDATATVNDHAWTDYDTTTRRLQNNPILEHPSDQISEQFNMVAEPTSPLCLPSTTSPRHNDTSPSFWTTTFNINVLQQDPHLLDDHLWQQPPTSLDIYLDQFFVLFVIFDSWGYQLRRPSSMDYFDVDIRHQIFFHITVNVEIFFTTASVINI